MRKTKTVTLYVGTLERIRKLGEMGQSYDDAINMIINELLECRQKPKSINKNKQKRGGNNLLLSVV